jgi:hypothetical protein
MVMQIKKFTKMALPLAKPVYRALVQQVSSTTTVCIGNQC